MKNAVFYKTLWLMPKSKSLEFYEFWKKQTDPKLARAAQKKLEEHLKTVEANYRVATE